MSIVRTALPLVLLTSVLTGCAGLQKTDWPTCAAVGGVVGAGLGATESASWAGYGALLVGGTHGRGLVAARLGQLANALLLFNCQAHTGALHVQRCLG